jgi:hypothetical protein
MRIIYPIILTTIAASGSADPEQALRRSVLRLYEPNRLGGPIEQFLRTKCQMNLVRSMSSKWYYTMISSLEFVDRFRDFESLDPKDNEIREYCQGFIGTLRRTNDIVASLDRLDVLIRNMKIRRAVMTAADAASAPSVEDAFPPLSPIPLSRSSSGEWSSVLDEEEFALPDDSPIMPPLPAVAVSEALPGMPLTTVIFDVCKMPVSEDIFHLGEFRLLANAIATFSSKPHGRISLQKGCNMIRLAIAVLENKVDHVTLQILHQLPHGLPHTMHRSKIPTINYVLGTKCGMELEKIKPLSPEMVHAISQYLASVPSEQNMFGFCDIMQVYMSSDRFTTAVRITERLAALEM